MSFINLSDVGFRDSQLDAFGNLPVAEPRTAFDSQQEYGLDTLRIWDACANGTLSTPSTNGSVTNGSNAVGPRSVNTGMTPITVSSTNGHYSILQSRQYVRYIPGKGHRAIITGVFASAANAAAQLVLRSSTSGTVSDAMFKNQVDWSVDTFGAGTLNPSGITLDFTKIQILVIDAQMLYAGRVRCGFEVDGKLYWAHYFEIANNQSIATVQTFNLPVRMEAQTVGATTEARVGYFDNANGVFLKTTSTGAGGTVQFECCSVQSFGGIEPRGFPNSAPIGVTTVAVTTRRPIVSIRPKTTYNGKTNRAHIEEIETILRATNNDALIEFVMGGTLTGAAFTSVGTASTVEYDVTATAISGGVTIKQGFAISSSGANAIQTGASADLRAPLVLSQINALTATQTPFTVVATSLSGTSNITPLINWHEQVI